MKCTDFENRLNELLDERLSPQEDAALIGHAENCLDCREMLSAQESLFRGMAQLQRRSIAPELGSRVLSELNAPATPIMLPPPVKRPFRWMPVLASAAAVLMAVSVGLWIVSQRNRQPMLVQPGQQEKDRHQGLAIIKPGGSRSASQPVSPPKTIKPEPVPQPESIVVTPAPQVEPFSPQPDIDGAMASIASHWQASSQWQVESIDVEHYAPGFRPIRESFEVAIDALLKTIPQGKKETRPAPPQAQYGEMLDLA